MKDSWIERFKNEALPKIVENFKPERIILFGSRIHGKAREDSDIDVIIVSKTFSNIPSFDRMPLVLKTIKFPKHIDFFCYTQEEFERISESSSIIMDALENCLEVKV
jgi:predicted nucleotidyltransferase